MYLIERATEEDLDEILTVINEVMFTSFKDLVPVDMRRNLIITYDDFCDIYESFIFLSYKIKGRIKGVAGLEIIGKEKGLVRYVYILPKYQRQGIGRELMFNIENEAKKESIAKLKLFTLEQATWAIEFYKKIGYRILISRESDMGNYVVMEKEL